MTDAPTNGSSSLVPSQVLSINLRGPAGRLEALLNTGKEDARYAAVIAHPHPLFGGTMHNKVVYHAMKSFQSFGIPVLRFNFRGAGLSEGTHDNGNGEAGDLRAALDWMQQEYERPLLFAGFSFGAFVGLKACCGDDRVKGIAALGMPVRAGDREYRYRFLSQCAGPKLFISGAVDEFGPQAEVEAAVAQAMPPAELVMVPGADHFFSGKLEFMQQALNTWIESHFCPAPSAATPLMSMHDDARSIYHHALAASSIPAAFDRVSWESFSLERYARIFAVAVGKAALPMLDALRAHLPHPLTGGVCCAPLLPEQRIPGIDYFTGGHPLPNQDSFASACRAVSLLRDTTAQDFVIFLISGGGSAMFELPLDPDISLQETQVLYQALMGSGATIAEINTVRKHFSAVKGGRLAAAAPHAAKVSLLVSDVAPRFLDALASGPTLPDSSTVAQCREILERYGLDDRFTPGLRSFFANPELPETPRLPTGPVETLLSSEDLLQAAEAHARTLGYEVVIDNTCDDWDYADATRYLLDRFQQLKQQHAKLCLLSGGEVTVRLGHQHGAGGRNQQFALACALELAEPSQSVPMVVLSAGSDGIDGNSPAAGALADATTVLRGEALGMDAESALARFDAYPLFTALGDTLVTGPTHNNLRDLRILLGG